MRRGFWINIAVTLACLLSTPAFTQTPDSWGGAASTKGLIYLINADANEEMDGLLRWEAEL